MPLLSPSQIHSVLRETAAAADGKSTSAAPALSLTHLLEKNNLTPDEILFQLSSQMLSSEQANVRLQAAKIALQLNGLLDVENARPDFQVTIIINDSEFGGGANPILIPRQ